MTESPRAEPAVHARLRHLGPERGRRLLSWAWAEEQFNRSRNVLARHPLAGRPAARHARMGNLE